MSDPSWVDVATLIVAAAGGSFGLWQYVQSQKWQRLEFVAREIKEFLADPESQNAMLMLDWNERSIDLFPEHPDARQRSVIVDDERLFRALAARQRELTEHFDDIDGEIRACFDTFLGYLQRFEQYIKSGLVAQEAFLPYLSYWFELIHERDGKRKRPLVLLQVRDFICVYDYRDVVDLFERFGMSIRPTEAEQEQLAKLVCLPSLDSRQGGTDEI